jgi:hypothetical protein
MAVDPEKSLLEKPLKSGGSLYEAVNIWLRLTASKAGLVSGHAHPHFRPTSLCSYGSHLQGRHPLLTFPKCISGRMIS